MQQSSFDLETHARHRREAALRWARQERLGDEAQRGRQGVQVKPGGIARMVGRLQALLARVRAQLTVPAMLDAPSAAGCAAVVEKAPMPVVSDRSVRSRDPFAAIVVIARVTNAPVGESSWSVNDA